MLMLVFWYCLPDALIKVSYKQNFMSYVTTSSSFEVYIHVCLCFKVLRIMAIYPSTNGPLCH